MGKQQLCGQGLVGSAFTRCDANCIKEGNGDVLQDSELSHVQSLVILRAVVLKNPGLYVTTSMQSIKHMKHKKLCLQGCNLQHHVSQETVDMFINPTKVLCAAEHQ